MSESELAHWHRRELMKVRGKSKELDRISLMANDRSLNDAMEELT